MPTNDDSFVITAAMLAYSWVKPSVTFYTGVGKANSSDLYLPGTTPEKAGTPGGPNSCISADPNYSFAIAAEGPAVECDHTMSISNIETLMAGGKAKK
jgi:hypothetical protein